MFIGGGGVRGVERLGGGCRRRTPGEGSFDRGVDDAGMEIVVADGLWNDVMFCWDTLGTRREDGTAHFFIDGRWCVCVVLVLSYVEGWGAVCDGGPEGERD